MVRTLFSQSYKSLFYFLLPFMLLGVCIAFVQSITPNLVPYRLILVSAPYLLFFFTALLCIYFNRNRIFYSAILLTLVNGLMSGSITMFSDSHLIQVYTGIGLLLPPTFALFAWQDDHRVLSVNSLILLVWLLAASGFVTWLALWARPEVTVWLSESHFSLVVIKKLHLLLMPSLPQLVFISLLASIGVIALRLAMKRTWVNHTFFIIVCVLAYLLSTDPLLYMTTLLFLLLGAMLLIAILNDSHSMAYRDELTGILGRRALNECFKRLGRRYSIAMLDIDHFKKFNDTYGHDVGDQALKMVAAKMSRIAGGGQVFRYGGEEFVIVFARKDADRAKVYLEDMREQIAGYPMMIRSKTRPKKTSEGKKFRRTKVTKKRVKVMVSIGVAEKGDQLRLPEQVLKAADKALYKAKKAGRNRLCMA